MGTETWPVGERHDRLPEQSEYRDDGCGKGCTCSPECQFPRCRLDDPLGWRRMERGARDREVMRVGTAKGLTVDVLAIRSGISRRTVHRILADARKTAGAHRLLSDAGPR